MTGPETSVLISDVSPYILSHFIFFVLLQVPSQVIPLKPPKKNQRTKNVAAGHLFGDFFFCLFGLGWAMPGCRVTAEAYGKERFRKRDRGWATGPGFFFFKKKLNCKKKKLENVAS